MIAGKVREKRPSLELTKRKFHEYQKNAMSEAHKRIAGRWKENGVNLWLEVLFPNLNNKQNPYSVDIALIDYKYLIEIDGGCHNGKEVRDNERDKHIISMSEAVESKWEMLRIKLEIPNRLIYGDFDGNKRAKVKKEYIAWLNDFADAELAKIINKSNR